jgi:transcriptional regulator with XRE-family HTH domain
MTAVNPGPTRDRHWVCAQRLRERRLALGLTQREVADRLAELGTRTSNRALSAMENGRGLDLGMLPELAGSLDCSVTYLLGLTSDPGEWRPGNHPAPAPGPAPQPTPQQVPQRSPLSTPTTPARLASGGILGPDVPAGFSAWGRGRARP